MQTERYELRDADNAACKRFRDIVTVHVESCLVNTNFTTVR